MQLNLFIDTSSKSLLSTVNGGISVNPSSLPLFFPDTLTLNVYLLQPIGNAPIGNTQYQTVPTTGLSLLLYLDGGVEGSPILTQVVTWVTDPTDSFFIGNLSLNTVQVQQNLGKQQSLRCYLKIGYIQNGLSTTLISSPVSILPGLPTNPLVVPPGLVPLSVQAAQAMFVPLAGLAGEGFYLITPNGKKLFLQAIDQPDGTASFLASPVN
jgi:hypothetical protein